MSYLTMVVVMFVLPFFSVESYSIVSNTTSHLGAQHAPYAWIMNGVFIMLGVATILLSFVFKDKQPISQYLLVLFGAALIMTAVFRHRPILSDVEFNVMHDQLHSLSASIVGFSFVLFSFSFLISRAKKSIKIIAVLLGTAATLLSLMMLFFPEYMGVFQRIMFIGSFFWIIKVSDMISADL
jgi:hypothetical protein